MPTYRYTLTEYDTNKPWLIKSTSTGLTVQLERAGDFAEWASGQWPKPRYAATLDPAGDWGLSAVLGSLDP